MIAKKEDQSALWVRKSTRAIDLGVKLTLFLDSSLKSLEIPIPAVRYECFNGD